MIVLTCVAVPHAGREEECRAAARELTEASQDHGMIGYFWTTDSVSPNIRVIEVHADAASVINHIARADVGRLAAAASFQDIVLFGDSPTPALQDALSGFGDYAVHPTL